MNFPELPSIESITEKYDFLMKLEQSESDLKKCLCYVGRCFKLEEIVNMYMNFICEHFKMLIEALLRAPNNLSFESLILEQIER
jgi:hypothetical protein